MWHADCPLPEGIVSRSCGCTGFPLAGVEREFFLDFAGADVVDGDVQFAAFLAAAARACDDAETAERLERPLDAKYLRRKDGFYWLEVGREWRIGATAQRILALAAANGSRFREWTPEKSATR